MPPFVVDSLDALKGLVGQEVATSEWLLITQERIHDFAEATEDRQWIHVDPERAKRESPYRATVAHGFLTLSLLSQFLGQSIRVQSGVRLGINYGLNRVRFPAPVPVDSKMRARFTLQSVKELPDAFEAVWSVVLECAGASKPSCVAEWIVRYYP